MITLWLYLCAVCKTFWAICGDAICVILVVGIFAALFWGVAVHPLIAVGVVVVFITLIVVVLGFFASKALCEHISYKWYYITTELREQVAERTQAKKEAKERRDSETFVARRVKELGL